MAECRPPEVCGRYVYIFEFTNYCLNSVATKAQVYEFESLNNCRFVCVMHSLRLNRVTNTYHHSACAHKTCGMCYVKSRASSSVLKMGL